MVKQRPISAALVLAGGLVLTGSSLAWAQFFDQRNVDPGPASAANSPLLPDLRRDGRALEVGETAIGGDLRGSQARGVAETPTTPPVLRSEDAAPGLRQRASVVAARPEPPRYAPRSRPFGASAVDGTEASVFGRDNDPVQSVPAATGRASARAAPPTGDPTDPAAPAPLSPVITPTTDAAVQRPVRSDVSRLPPADVNGLDDDLPPGAVDPTADPNDPQAADQSPEDAEPVSPYDPQGVFFWSLRLFPAIEVSAGRSRDTGDTVESDDEDSDFYAVAPELGVRSVWLRHEFEANLRGRLARYPDRTDGDEQDLVSDARLTLDVTRFTQISIEGLYDTETLERGDDGVPQDAVSRPNLHIRQAAIELNQRFNRLTGTLRGTRTEFDYENTERTDGTFVDNGFLDYRLDEARLRLGYEVSPKTEIFGEAYADHAEYERAALTDGTLQGSEGEGALIGVIWRPTGKLELAGSVGFDRRRPDEPSFVTDTEPSFEGSLLWQPTALTELRLRASQGLLATSTDGASSVETRELEIAATHDLFRHVRLTGGLIYGEDRYKQTGREDDRITLTGRIAYLFNRYLQAFAQLDYEDVQSNREGSTRTDTDISVGLRVQY